VIGAGIEHDVVDGHVHGVFHQRRFDFVGGADQGFRALDLFMHVDDFGGGRNGRHDDRRGFSGLVFRLVDAVRLDFFCNFDGHYCKDSWGIR